MATYVSKATGNWLTAGTWYNTEAGTRGIFTTISTGTNTTTSLVYNTDATDITGTNAKNCVGLLMYCKRLTSTGTIDVTLSADSGTTATKTLQVNATDLPLNPAWTFFQFATVLTLDGGTDYAIGVKGSSAGNATFYGASGSPPAGWAHILVYDDSPAGSPTTGDVFYIAGVQTGAAAETACVITMDETAATDYGTVDIGNIGTLSFDSSAGKNPYLRLSGALTVGCDGALNIGTTGTPIPRDSTAILEFDCASDSQFGISCLIGSTAIMQGLSRTVGKNVIAGLLNTSTANADTHFHLNTDSGWLSGDLVGIASTSRTYTEAETKILNGDAGAEICNVTANFGATVHLGVSPTQAEVILLTRNIRVRSVSATNMYYLAMNPTSMTVDLDWAEFYYYDGGSFTNDANVQYCSFHDCEDYGVYFVTKSGFTFSNNCIYYVGVTQGNTSGVYFGDCTSGTISGNYIMKVTGGNQNENSGVVQINGYAAITFTNNYISSSTAAAAVTVFSPNNFSMSGNVIHSNSGIGLRFTTASTGTLAVNTLTCWRNSGYGLSLFSTGPLAYNNFTISGGTYFGNTTANIYVNNQYLSQMLVENITCCADTTFATTYGITHNNPGYWEMTCNGCTFYSVSGIYTNNTTADILAVNSTTAIGGGITLNNCTVSPTTLTTSMTNNANKLWKVSSTYTNGVAGGETWSNVGLIKSDTTVYNDGTYTNAAPCEKITPKSATVRTTSGSKKVAVASGATFTISVYVRKSKAAAGDTADYNGADQPRLILKRNDGMGVTADVVCDTVTAAIGVWELLTYTTSAGQALVNGVLEFVVDCDGTAGFINVDAWSVT